MQIKIEEIPILKIINFCPAAKIRMETDVIVADNRAELKNDFFSQIFAIPGVERCLVTSDVLSVKYNTEDLEELKILTMALLDDFLEAGDFLQPEAQLSVKDSLEALADSLIRPTLVRDNGNLEICSLQEDTLEVAFTGHCAGCPYAQNTLQNIVTKTFLRYFPQIKEVKLEG